MTANRELLSSVGRLMQRDRDLRGEDGTEAIPPAHASRGDLSRCTDASKLRDAAVDKLYHRKRKFDGAPKSAGPGVATSPASAIAVVKLCRSRYIHGYRADTGRAFAQHAVDE
jgi:hypothetical protein